MSERRISHAEVLDTTLSERDPKSRENIIFSDLALMPEAETSNTSFINLQEIIEELNVIEEAEKIVEGADNNKVISDEAKKDLGYGVVLGIKKKNLIEKYIRDDIRKEVIEERERKRKNKHKKGNRFTKFIDSVFVEFQTRKREPHKLSILADSLFAARENGDKIRTGRLEEKIGKKDIMRVDMVLNKAGLEIDDIKQRLENHEMKKDEQAELLAQAARELLRYRKLPGLIKSKEKRDDFANIFQLAGYDKSETKKLMFKTLASVPTTIAAWLGPSSISAAVVASNWNSSFITALEGLPAGSHPYLIGASLLGHGAVLATSHFISRSNMRLLRSTGFSPEVNTMVSYNVVKNLFPENRSLEEKTNHASYWFLSPKIYEEIAYVGLNFVNPLAALSAHAVTEGILLGRLALQNGAAKVAENRNKRKEISEKKKEKMSPEFLS